MKTKIFFFAAFAALLFFVSCKKESTKPQLTFTGNITEVTANASGEYNITGHISSPVRLDKVTLTKEGETTPFLIDESTAKNKNEYDFNYLVTGITANIYIIINVYDQEGNITTQRFLINK